MNLSRYIQMQFTAPKACLKALQFSRTILTRASKGMGQVVQDAPKFIPVVCRRLMSSTDADKFEVINIQSEEDFKKRVLEASANKPVVVDFHASWCGPCKLLGPRLESLLSEERGKVSMAKVDIDKLSDITMEYGVRSVPTVIGVKNGKVLNQFTGLQDDDQIKTFIDKLVAS